MFVSLSHWFIQTIDTVNHEQSIPTRTISVSNFVEPWIYGVAPALVDRKKDLKVAGPTRGGPEVDKSWSVIVMLLLLL